MRKFDLVFCELTTKLCRNYSGMGVRVKILALVLGYHFPGVSYPHIGMSRSMIWSSMGYHIAGFWYTPEVPKRMGRVLSTGGGGGEASPPKCKSPPPNIFIRFGKTLLSNSHTLAINFLSAINKVQSSKLCHRLSINRSC